MVTSIASQEVGSDHAVNLATLVFGIYLSE